MSIGVYPDISGSNFWLEVSKGTISDTSGINKFGNNPTLATAATETIWDGSNNYTFPSTADITHLRQAVDQLAMRGETIEIQGLDTNFAYVLQTADLDGTDTTTPVALGTALKRVFRMRVLSSVVASQNIELRNVGGGITYGLIIAGEQQTQMAIYTVPAGMTAYMDNYWASLNKDSGGGDPDVTIKLWEIDNTNGYAPQLKHLRGLDSGATSVFVHQFTPFVTIAEKTDIYLTASNLSATATADVSAGFDLVLVNN